MPVDRPRAEAAIAELLRALGHDPSSDPELVETPERVARAWADELLAGYAVDVPALLAGGALSSESPGIVVVRGIALATVCPHHLLPSVGTATVAYLPGKRLLGLGTIAALVEAFARRLALQEDIGHNVVTALMEHAGARGAYCRIELSHACLNARSRTCGQASVVTTAQAGELDLAALSLALEEPR